MSKRDKRDDDGINEVDPIKATIGFFKTVFKVIESIYKFVKLIYDLLTSPNKIVSIGMAIFLLLVIASIGSCVYMATPAMHMDWSDVGTPTAPPDICQQIS